MTTKTVSPLDAIKDNILEIVKPLITGEAVNYPADQVSNLTADVRSLYEMATKVREAHDRMIVAWEEGNNVEPGEDPNVQTIRARKQSKKVSGGFLTL